MNKGKLTGGYQQHTYRCVHSSGTDARDLWYRDNETNPIDSSDVPEKVLEAAKCAAPSFKPIPRQRDARGRFTCATIANVTHWYEDGREIRREQVPKDKLGIKCVVPKESPKKSPSKAKAPKESPKKSPSKKVSPAKKLLQKAKKILS